MKVLVKIDDYVIIQCDAVKNFERQIKEYLKSGYQLDGHPFVFNELICQAMIKVTRSAIGNVN